MANKIQIRRGLKANLPTLDAGEPALCTDTKEVFVGNTGGNVALINKEEMDEHLKNYILQIPYAIAGGSANAYTATLNPALTSYAEGVAVAVKINVTNTGASTININGLGAKSIRDSKGNTLTAGKLTAGSIYTLRYNGTNFILQGEGGEYGDAEVGDVIKGKTIGTEDGLKTGTLELTGNAAVGDVLSGKTFYKDNPKNKQTGTMTNQGAKIITPSTTNQAIAAGYHNGSGYAKGDENLVAENIRSEVSIFNKVGTLEPILELEEKGASVGSMSNTTMDSDGNIYEFTTNNKTLKKYSNSGSEVWSQSFASISGGMSWCDVCVLNDGSKIFLVVEGYSGDDDFISVLLLNQNGGTIWKKTLYTYNPFSAVLTNDYASVHEYNTNKNYVYDLSGTLYSSGGTSTNYIYVSDEAHSYIYRINRGGSTWVLSKLSSNYATTHWSTNLYRKPTKLCANDNLVFCNGEIYKTSNGELISNVFTSLIGETSNCAVCEKNAIVSYGDGNFFLIYIKGSLQLSQFIEKYTNPKTFGSGEYLTVNGKVMKLI